MKIRLLTKRDISQASAIVAQNYTRKWQLISVAELKSMFSNSAINPTFFVAEEDGRVVGFVGHIQSWADYNIYQIFWLNVLPEKQKQGIGMKLISKAVADIKKKNRLALIELSASIRNAPYYKKHFGFKTVQRFGPTGHHLMVLDLAVRARGTA